MWSILWQTWDNPWTTPVCTTNVWSASLKILTQLYCSSINAPKTIKFDLLMVVSFSCESTNSTILVSLNTSYYFETCGLFIDTTQLTLLKLINFISLMVGCFSECDVGNHDNESRKILFFIYQPNLENKITYTEWHENDYNSSCWAQKTWRISLNCRLRV